MSTHAGPPLRKVERLAATTAFGFAYGASLLLAAPALLLAWAATLFGLAFDGVSFGSMSALAFVMAASAGAVALLRSHSPARARSAGTVERLLVCLALGIAAALVVLAFLAGAAVGSGGFRVLGATAAGIDAVLLVAGIAAVQRLKRRYAAAAGRPFDTLPMIFLLVAIGLALCAMLLMLRT